MKIKTCTFFTYPARYSFLNVRIENEPISN